MVLAFTVGVVTDVLPVIVGAVTESVVIDVFVICVGMTYPIKNPEAFKMAK